MKNHITPTAAQILAASRPYIYGLTRLKPDAEDEVDLARLCPTPGCGNERWVTAAGRQYVYCSECKNAKDRAAWAKRRADAGVVP